MFLKKYNKHKKKFTMIIISCLLFMYLIKLMLFNNFNFMFLTAECFNRPSRCYHFILGRIYRISVRKEIAPSLIDRIMDDKNKALDYHYIRVLGVIGEEDATSVLLKKLIDNLNMGIDGGANNSLCIITSLGLIGDKDIVPVLEKCLEHYDSWLNSSIAAALYIITGKKYEFVNTNGKKQQFIPTQEIEKAYEIVSRKSGEQRSYEELIKLDKIFRPPNY